MKKSIPKSNLKVLMLFILVGAGLFTPFTGITDSPAQTPDKTALYRDHLKKARQLSGSQKLCCRHV